MPLFPSSGLSAHDAQQLPELQQLITVSRKLSGKPFGDFFPAIKAFLDSQFLRKFFKFELCRLSEELNYGRLANETTIDIVTFPEYTLQLGRLRKLTQVDLDGSEVSSYATDIIYYNLGPCSIPFELHRAPPEQRNDVFDRRCIPIFANRSLLRPGDLITLSAGIDILKFLPFEQDVFQVAVVSRKEKSLEWHYDYNTLNPLYCSAGRTISSTMQHAITVLVKMGSVRAAPEIALAYNSADHFVRWSAVRAVLALDDHLGRELLERAKSDAHPHVRSAAAKTENLLMQ